MARSANRVLATLAADLETAPSAIALRDCPSLPESLKDQINSWTAQNAADSVMYRELLAEAAISRGWMVHWYKHKRVEEDSAAAAKCKPAVLRRFLGDLRSTLGAPWQKDHRMAAASAIGAFAQAEPLDFDQYASEE